MNAIVDQRRLAPVANQRAYAVFEVREVNEDKRVITGVATTPSVDRMGDIIEPLGVSYKNPLPLLWQHKASEPVGLVKFDKPSADGITYTATFAKATEPGRLKDRVDEAWQSVKLGLVRAVSIGFRPIEYSFMDDGGIRFIETEVYELSLVTIPAQQDATIDTIKAIDDTYLAASGSGSVRATPGATGSQTKPKGKQMTTLPAVKKKRTIAEQVADFQSTREQKMARMSEIMEADAGETLAADLQEEYDTLADEVEKIDAHIQRLYSHEARMQRTARPVQGDDPQQAAQSRAPVVTADNENAGHGVRVSVKANLPPGITFARYTMALAASNGNLMQALEISKRWNSESPELQTILRAAVNAGTTTATNWAAPLVEYQIMAQEFINYLRPRTIIGRIPGLRMVPFKVKVPRQTTASSVNWIGEGKVKPVSELAFDSVSMDFHKIAGIVALTDELVRFSNPAAETLVRDDLAGSIIQFMDQQFVDPTKALQAAVSPASITNGVTPVPATGTTADALRSDIKTLVQTFLDAEMSLDGAVFLMTQGRALALSLLTNALGQPEFGGLGMQGGTLAGIPVITSENMPATGSSPANGDMIILLKAPEIMLADDGMVTIDASREAAIQLNSTPDSPASASTVLISLWQHNMIAIKAERYITWLKRRAEAVQYIAYAKYGN